MSQTTKGIITHRKTMIARHGSYEAYRQYMSAIGKKGGKSPKTKPSGFLKMKLDGETYKIREAGSRGGKVSKRSANT